MFISIHAPTRGATFSPDSVRDFVTISIHAPTRGATSKIMQIWASQIDFNPRSHEGSDQMQLHRVLWWKISIHAPTRGATLTNQKCCFIVKNFNPRSHEGSDPRPLEVQHHLMISIHAPTRGATITALTYRSAQTISIHAPTRGATVRTDDTGYSGCDFNPRSHEGSDGQRVAPTWWRSDFNPRSHEGSDLIHFVFSRCS